MTTGTFKRSFAFDAEAMGLLKRCIIPDRENNSEDYFFYIDIESPMTLKIWTDSRLILGTFLIDWLLIIDWLIWNKKKIPVHSSIRGWQNLYGNCCELVWIWTFLMPLDIIWWKTRIKPFFNDDLCIFRSFKLLKIAKYLWYYSILKIRMVLLDQSFCDNFFVKITFGIQIV